MWPRNPPLARRRASFWTALATPCLALALTLAACSGGEAPPDFKTLETGVVRPGIARADIVAYLVASDGSLVIRDAKGGEVASAPGTPLLASDSLTPAKDALALVLLHNGYTVRVDGGVTLRVDALAVFKDPPATRSIEDQLRATLSDQERGRLGDAGERIGGWQLRRTALDALPPEEMPKRDDRAAAAGPAETPVAASPTTPSTPMVELKPGDVAAEEEEADEDLVKNKRSPPTDDEAKKDGAPTPEDVAHGSGLSKKAKSEVPHKKPIQSEAPDPASDPKPESDPVPMPVPDTKTVESSSHSGDKGSTVPAPWKKSKHRWISGDATDPPSAAILDGLNLCLISKSGTKATARLTFAKGKVTAVTIDSVDSKACVDALKSATGVNGSGFLEIELTR